MNQSVSAKSDLEHISDKSLPTLNNSLDMIPCVLLPGLGHEGTGEMLVILGFLCLITMVTTIKAAMALEVISFQ